jgi:hypothetical protein
MAAQVAFLLSGCAPTAVDGRRRVIAEMLTVAAGATS